jgi:hypothetical protein
LFDAGDTNLMLQCSPPSGATFGPGRTTVTCAVTDGSGNRSTCSFDVEVVDADPGRISGLAVQSGVRISMPTQAGVHYQVEYKNSLTDPIWEPLTIVVGDGAVMTIVDPDPAEEMRFYRVCAP